MVRAVSKSMEWKLRPVLLGCGATYRHDGFVLSQADRSETPQCQPSGTLVHVALVCEALAEAETTRGAVEDTVTDKMCIAG